MTSHDDLDEKEGPPPTAAESGSAARGFNRDPAVIRKLLEAATPEQAAREKDRETIGRAVVALQMAHGECCWTKAQAWQLEEALLSLSDILLRWAGIPVE